MALKKITPRKAPSTTKVANTNKRSASGKVAAKPKLTGQPSSMTARRISPDNADNLNTRIRKIRCATEPKGSEMGRSNTRIVINVANERIPLWSPDTVLHWRFRESSIAGIDNPTAVKDSIRKLLNKSITAWGSAAPVQFKEVNKKWDFEIVVRQHDDCDIDGCFLASAFFPNNIQNEITLYPEMFTYSKKEQVATLVHELGHVFGLRHFFAQEEESEDPSVLFGKHSKFSIMNYGGLSKLTIADRKDLRTLYEQVWNGTLKDIKRRKIKLVKPFHTTL